MNFLKSLFRFYINASIHVALAITALTVITYKTYGLALEYNVLIFIFLSGITGYNFVKFAPLAKLNHKRLTNQLRQIQLFSLLTFLGLCISAFYISAEILIIAFLLAVLNFFYAVPLGEKNLREISLLKVFIIALIWTITTLTFPLWSTYKIEMFSEGKIIRDSIERFIWILLLMVPFEVRDLRYDKHKFATMASVFGVVKLKRIAIGIIMLLLILKTFWLLTEYYLLDVIIYISLAFFILSSKQKQNPFFASFWVEILPVFWLFSFYLLY